VSADRGKSRRNVSPDGEYPHPERESAFYETTRVKSIVGAIAEEFNFDINLLNKLKESLNPVSMVYLNVGAALMYASNWQIRAER